MNTADLFRKSITIEARWGQSALTHRDHAIIYTVIRGRGSFHEQVCDKNIIGISNGFMGLIEVMGHRAGWLALYARIAGGGDIIPIPEIPYSINSIVHHLMRRDREGKQFSIVSKTARQIGTCFGDE